MSVLLGPKGQPISSKDYQNKKAAPPALGTRYGQWAGDNVPIFTLPGGGAIGFDTSTLTLADFRQMKQHYQINSSLSVLTFMMHQMEWHIESENKAHAAFVEENLNDIWSRLVRAMSQSLWCGFSPSALEWENDVQGRAIVLSKVKDLIPEDCRVKWKKVDVSIPRDGDKPAGKFTHQIYDGIKQFGAPDIPVDSSFWYPLLMENGNYYGRRILESAFQPWFFSTLMHLFANRYYERFGEPVPVGRAPYEDEIDVNGTPMRGNQLMALILQQLRNRSTVILPNEKTPFGDETNPGYDYQIEYLESQMRGADFERYMTRLDEEMSLAMFTPILMMRTADVGSYNLGTQHSQVYQWMLNAIAGDWAHYINRYIIAPLIRFNFGVRAPKARIRFMKMGKIQADLLQQVVSALVAKDAIKPDIREIGEYTGMTWEEIETVRDEPAPDPGDEPDENTEEESTGNVVRLLKRRVKAQVKKAFNSGDFDKGIALGYRRQIEDAMRRDGYDNADRRVTDLYKNMDERIATLTALGVGEFETPDNFMNAFGNIFDNEMKQVAA